jgi:hypothetical protein
MLSNFLQKPLGIATILGAAVGAPYAAFETDLGNSVRQVVSRLVSSNTGNGSSPNNAAATDPYSLQYTSNTDPHAWSANYGGQVPMPNQWESQIYGQPNTQTYDMPIGGVSPNYIATRSGPATAIPGGTPQLWDYTLGTPSLSQIQQQPNTSVGGGVVSDLREVLRFDIKPGWLPQRFARVSTVLSNVQLDGLRVPLVTGTQPTDLAGSLTYYFDASQSLQRINLSGLTGDPTNLANLMVQYYQLQPEQCLGGQLLTARWNNRITSVVLITPAPIIYAGADHSKYIVFMELNQPSQNFGLSEEAAETLRQAQATQRF